MNLFLTAQRNCRHIGLAAFLCATASASVQAQSAPAAATPPPKSTSAASVIEVSVPSGKASMKGTFYLARGAEPHATVVLLHGFPGNEKNLDLAQALQRAGMNVLFFTYRGAWGSEGAFSFANALDDVTAVKAFLQTESVAAQYRIDPTRLSLLGHSFGGYVGIRSMQQHKDLTCVAALAPANIGTMAASVAGDPTASEQFEVFLRAPDSIKWGSGSASQPILDDAASSDLNKMSPGLKDRPVLIIGASNDVATPLEVHVNPLIAEWKSASIKNLTWTVFVSDHSFSDRRTALSRLVVSWFRKQCYQVAG